MSVLAPVRARTRLAAREWLRFVSRNFHGAHPGDFGKPRIGGLYRINAKVSFRAPNQMAVEIVPVGFGEPRPGKNIGDDFIHSETSIPRWIDRYLKTDARPSMFLPSLSFSQQQGLYNVPGRTPIAHQLPQCDCRIHRQKYFDAPVTAGL